jgi:outer membrane protein assembly factor BamD (BamD/ComL family)
MKKYLLFPLVCVLPLLALEEGELNWDEQGPSVQEYNSYLQQALRDQNWWAVIDYADIISYNFPTSPFAQDMAFMMGEAYFNLGQLELSNECFSSYLNHNTSPRHFEKAIEYKFNIAEQFKSGVKKPLFGSHKLPKIVPAKEDAVQIYDEVITTLPHSEFAAQSLIGKAKIQAELEDYKPSLETLDLLIRRFPKHDLAAAAYLEKILVYLMQSQGQNLDPDLLDLAEVNLRKFRIAFPREPRIAAAEKSISEMQEIFAQNLLDTGRFFEKTKKIPASIIYYNKVIVKYPNTEAAAAARSKLEGFQASGKY